MSENQNELDVDALMSMLTERDEEKRPSFEIIENGLWYAIDFLAIQPGHRFRVRRSDGNLITNKDGAVIVMKAASYPMLKVEHPAKPGQVIEVDFRPDEPKKE